MSLDVGRVQRAYGVLPRVEPMIDPDYWHGVSLDNEGYPVLLLDPLSVVVYAERPELRIHPEELTAAVVADVLGLSEAHVLGFIDGLEDGTSPTPPPWRMRYPTTAEALTAYGRGHEEGAAVRSALLAE